MCHTVLVSFGCSGRDHNNKCRLYPNYLSICTHAKATLNTCEVHDIRPLYVVTALECPSCLSKAQKYSDTFGTEAFAPGETAYGALKRWFEHRLQLTPVRWSRPALEMMVRKWGSRSVPDNEEGRRKLQCVEETLHFYQLTTQRSTNKGPNSRLQIAGDGEVGRDVAEGVGRMGALHFRWVDIPPALDPRIEDNGVGVEEVADLDSEEGVSNGVVEDPDDEQSTPPETQTGVYLATTSAIREETTGGIMPFVGMNANYFPGYTGENIGIIENLKPLTETRPPTQQPVAQNTQNAMPWESDDSSWVALPAKSINDIIQPSQFPRPIPRSNAQWQAKTGLNDSVHWDHNPVALGPSRAPTMSSNHSEYHSVAKVNEPVPDIFPGGLALEFEENEELPGENAGDAQASLRQASLGPIPNNVTNGRFQMPCIPGTSNMYIVAAGYEAGPSDIVGNLPQISSISEGNGIIDMTTQSPGNLTMPFDVGQLSKSGGMVRKTNLARLLSSAYVPFSSEEHPRKLSTASGPKRRSKHGEKSRVLPVEQPSHRDGSGADRNIPIDPTSYGQQSNQSGSMAPPIPRMASQRPQSTQGVSTLRTAGPPRKRKADDPGEPDEALTARRTRR